MNVKTTMATRRVFLGTSLGTSAGMALASHAVAKDHAASLQSFRQQAVINLSQHGLRRIAVSVEGNVAIAAGNTIEMRDSCGVFRSACEFERPVRCVATSGADIVVGIRDHVRVLNQEGRLQHWLPTIGRGHLVGDVAVDGDTIVVTDVTAGAIKRFRRDGHWETLASRKTGFALPAGGRLTSVQDGVYTMTNPGRHRVELLNERGELLSSWGKRTRDENGFQGCCNPLAAVSMRDGTTVTAEAGQVRLKQFDAGGNLVRQIAGPESFDVAAVSSDSDDPSPRPLPCAVGGIDLAVAADDSLWMLHAAAKQLIRWKKFDGA